MRIVDSDIAVEEAGHHGQQPQAAQHRRTRAASEVPDADRGRAGGRAKLAFRRISIIDKTPPAAWCRGNNRSKPLAEERGEVARRPKSQARNIRATRGADPSLRPLPQR